MNSDAEDEAGPLGLLFTTALARGPEPRLTTGILADPAATLPSLSAGRKRAARAAADAITQDARRRERAAQAKARAHQARHPGSHVLRAHSIPTNLVLGMHVKRRQLPARPLVAGHPKDENPFHSAVFFNPFRDYDFKKEDRKVPRTVGFATPAPSELGDSDDGDDDRRSLGLGEDGGAGRAALRRAAPRTAGGAAASASRGAAGLPGAGGGGGGAAAGGGGVDGGGSADNPWAKPKSKADLAVEALLVAVAAAERGALNGGAAALLAALRTAERRGARGAEGGAVAVQRAYAALADVRAEQVAGAGAGAALGTMRHEAQVEARRRNKWAPEAHVPDAQVVATLLPGSPAAKAVAAAQAKAKAAEDAAAKAKAKAQAPRPPAACDEAAARALALVEEEEEEEENERVRQMAAQRAEEEAAAAVAAAVQAEELAAAAVPGEVVAEAEAAAAAAKPIKLHGPLLTQAAKEQVDDDGWVHDEAFRVEEAVVPPSFFDLGEDPADDPDAGKRQRRKSALTTGAVYRRPSKVLLSEKEEEEKLWFAQKLRDKRTSRAVLRAEIDRRMQAAAAAAAAAQQLAQVAAAATAAAAAAEEMAIAAAKAAKADEELAAAAAKAAAERAAAQVAEQEAEAAHLFAVAEEQAARTSSNALAAAEAAADAAARADAAAVAGAAGEGAAAGEASAQAGGVGEQHEEAGDGKIGGGDNEEEGDEGEQQEEGGEEEEVEEEVEEEEEEEVEEDDDDDDDEEDGAPKVWEAATELAQQSFTAEELAGAKELAQQFRFYCGAWVPAKLVPASERKACPRMRPKQWLKLPEGRREEMALAAAKARRVKSNAGGYEKSTKERQRERAIWGKSGAGEQRAMLSADEVREKADRKKERREKARAAEQEKERALEEAAVKAGLRAAEGEDAISLAKRRQQARRVSVERFMTQKELADAAAAQAARADAAAAAKAAADAAYEALPAVVGRDARELYAMALEEHEAEQEALYQARLAAAEARRTRPNVLRRASMEIQAHVTKDLAMTVGALKKAEGAMGSSMRRASAVAGETLRNAGRRLSYAATDVAATTKLVAREVVAGTVGAAAKTRDTVLPLLMPDLVGDDGTMISADERYRYYTNQRMRDEQSKHGAIADGLEARERQLEELRAADERAGAGRAEAQMAQGAATHERRLAIEARREAAAGRLEPLDGAGQPQPLSRSGKGQTPPMSVDQALALAQQSEAYAGQGEHQTKQAKIDLEHQEMKMSKDLAERTAYLAKKDAEQRRGVYTPPKVAETNYARSKLTPSPSPKKRKKAKK
jgi:hypothetical protein